MNKHLSGTSDSHVHAQPAHRAEHGENGAGTPRVVNSELAVFVTVDEGHTAPLWANLHYDMADPYAVSITFHMGGDHTLPWVFARSLLAEGLARPTGVGQVRVRPSRAHGLSTVRISLMSNAGAAVVVAPARAIAAFLERADALIPPGMEYLHVDLDRLTHHVNAGST